MKRNHLFRRISTTGVSLVAALALLGSCADDTSYRRADGSPDAELDAEEGDVDGDDAAADQGEDTPGNVDAADANEEDVVPGDDTAPGDDAAPDGGTQADADAADLSPQDAVPDADVAGDADGGTTAFDGPADPDAPRICYGTDEPSERWVGYYIPFCMTGVPWPDAIIQTCWSQEASQRAEFATVSRTVESFVRENFDRPTGLDFFGWKVCEDNPDAGAPRADPAPGRLVLSLTDDADWSANLGYGAGGDRHLSIGLKSSFLASQVIEAFMHILGLSYRVGIRQPSPGVLTSNETAGLQVMFDRRHGGTIIGREARCLQAQHTDPAGEVDPGEPMPQLGSTVQVNDCLTDQWQDLQWNQDGALFLTSTPDVFLQADSSGQTVHLAPRKPELIEQIWSIKGASLRTDGLKCIGVPNGNFFEGQTVILTTCDGSAAQEWEVDFDTGKLRHGSMCLGVSDGVVQPKNPLQIQKCRATDTQTFLFRYGNQIQFKELCLNVLGNTNTDGSALALWQCIGSPVTGNELFYLHGRVQNGNSCLEMPNEPGVRSIGLKACSGSESQQWDIHMRPILKL